jgi:hypothetical protein
MQNLLFVSCLVFLLSLVLAAPVDAKAVKNGAANHSNRGNANRHDEDDEGDEEDERTGSFRGTSDVQMTTRRGGFFRNFTNSLSAEQQLLNEQRQVNERMAQAKRLREIAERTGNLNLLANADRMEADAIEHYYRRAAQLEKYGVTDPGFIPGDDPDPTPTPARANNPTPTPAVRNRALPPIVTEPTLASSGATEPRLAAGATDPVPAAATDPRLKSVLVKPAPKR